MATLAIRCQAVDCDRENPPPSGDRWLPLTTVAIRSPAVDCAREILHRLATGGYRCLAVENKRNKQTRTHIVFALLVSSSTLDSVRIRR